VVPCSALASQFRKRLDSALGYQRPLKLCEHSTDLGHGAPVRSSKVNLLCDGHQTDLASPEALQEGKLLGSVTTQPVHTHHHDGINFRASGVQQSGDSFAARTFT